MYYDKMKELSGGAEDKEFWMTDRRVAFYLRAYVQTFKLKTCRKEALHMMPSLLLRHASTKHHASPSVANMMERSSC